MVPVAVVAGILVLVAVGAWWFLRSPGSSISEDPLAQGDMDPGVQPPASVAPDAPLAELPELSASDEFVRSAVAELSERPQLAAWLANDNLVERFVGSIVALAGGQSPREHVPFLAPEQEFQVRETPGGLIVDPATYDRYNLLTQIFLSLDIEGTAELYAQLHPLFEEAYAELGIGGSSFEEALSLAIGNVLAVEVPDGEHQVFGSDGYYGFADPALENRSPLEGHLIRLGPENAGRVQAKLRQIANAIGIEPATSVGTMGSP